MLTILAYISLVIVSGAAMYGAFLVVVGLIVNSDPTKPNPRDR